MNTDRNIVEVFLENSDSFMNIMGGKYNKSNGYRLVVCLKNVFS